MCLLQQKDGNTYGLSHTSGLPFSPSAASTSLGSMLNFIPYCNKTIRTESREAKIQERNELEGLWERTALQCPWKAVAPHPRTARRLLRTLLAPSKMMVESTLDMQFGTWDHFSCDFWALGIFLLIFTVANRRAQPFDNLIRGGVWKLTSWVTYHWIRL